MDVENSNVNTSKYTGSLVLMSHPSENYLSCLCVNEVNKCNDM